MTSMTIRWTSVAIILVGVILLTFPNVGPWADGVEGRAHFIIPIAYFTTIVGAVGLCCGWFMKQRER